MKKIVIVGGGLSGLTTAYNLLKYHPNNFDVTILEAELNPGGQARSFVINGLTCENGSHVFFNYYKNVLNLINELRADPELTSMMPELSPVPGWTICNDKGQSATLKQVSWLPKPLDVFPSLLTIPWLSLWEKFKVAWATFKLILTPYDKFNKLDQKSAYDTALDYGYSENGANTWSAASLGLTNLFVSEQSGAIFCAKHKVLLNTSNGLRYQLPAGNLSHLIADPLKKKLEKMGCKFLFDVQVDTLDTLRPGDRNVAVYYSCNPNTNFMGYGACYGEYVVLAIKPQDAKKLLPWINAPWTQLQSVTPVITVVVKFNDKIKKSKDNREWGCSREDYVFSVVTDLSNYQPEYMGDKSVIRCEIGHADLLPNGIDTSSEVILKFIKNDLIKLFPETKDMLIEDFAMHRESKHLYTKWSIDQWSKKTQSLKERDLGKIILGGDWTTKGTIGMEAAVNSGIESANLILAKEGFPIIEFEDVPL